MMCLRWICDRYAMLQPLDALHLALKSAASPILKLLIFFSLCYKHMLTSFIALGWFKDAPYVTTYPETVKLI